MALPDDLDHDKLAQAALALLSLTQHDERRVWKALDWDLMDRLHDNGWIFDPKSKAQSVVMTERGEELPSDTCKSCWATRRRAASSSISPREGV